MPEHSKWFFFPLLHCKARIDGILKQEVFNVFIFVFFLKLFGLFDVRIWILILLLPVLSMAYIQKLKFIAYISAAANVLSFVGILGTYQYLFFHLENPANFPATAPLREFPLFFGTALFAFEGIGIVSIVF